MSGLFCYQMIPYFGYSFFIPSLLLVINSLLMSYCNFFCWFALCVSGPSLYGHKGRGRENDQMGASGLVYRRRLGICRLYISMF